MRNGRISTYIVCASAQYKRGERCFRGAPADISCDEGARKKRQNFRKWWCGSGFLWLRAAVIVLRHLAGVGIPQRLPGKERNLMKRKASTSHDEAIVRRLRKDQDFVAEYLKAALEDEDEPRVLHIALRHFHPSLGPRQSRQSCWPRPRRSLVSAFGSRQPSAATRRSFEVCRGHGQSPFARSERHCLRNRE